MNNRISKYFKKQLPTKYRKLMIHNLKFFQKGIIANFIINKTIHARARICWEEDEIASIINIECKPFNLQNKKERTLARFVDWNDSKLIQMVGEKIENSAVFEKFQNSLVEFLMFIESCEETYQFNFIQEIWNGSL